MDPNQQSKYAVFINSQHSNPNHMKSDSILNYDQANKVPVGELDQSHHQLNKSQSIKRIGNQHNVDLVLLEVKNKNVKRHNTDENRDKLANQRKFSEQIQYLDDSFSSMQIFKNQKDEKFIQQINKEFDLIKDAQNSNVETMGYKQNNLKEILKHKKQNLNVSDQSRGDINGLQFQNQPHMMITDVAMHFDDLDDLDLYYGINKSPNMKIPEKIKYWIQQNNIDLYFLLIILGLSVSTLSVLIDIAIEQLTNRMYLSLNSKSTSDHVYCWIQSIVCAVIAIFITVSFPSIEGSGIPETKSVISGISMYKYMAFSTFLFKSIALIFAIGAGYFVGKEGPFVHLSACIGNNLSKMSVFRRFYKKQTFRKQVKILIIIIQLLAIAAGVGVTATFGTPIGGCLYSIETVISHFQISHIWKSFICSFVAGSWLYYLNYQLNINIYARTYMGQIRLNSTEILLFVLFGIIIGLIASIFIQLLTKIVKFKQYLFKQHIIGPYSYSLLVIVLHLIFYQYSNFGLNKYSLKAVFNQTTFQEFGSDIQQSFTKLCIVTSIRLILHILALTCTIPSGNLIPLFFLGGLLGRIYSELARLLGSNLPSSCYAVIGAATLVSSTTHTILAIIVLTFEFTFQIKVLFPLMISIVTAYSISNYFQTSLYHLLIDIKQLPLLPRLLKPVFFNKVSRDIMETNIDFLHLNSTMGDIAIILNKSDKKIGCIPIVDNPQQLNLIGSVQYSNLSDYLYEQFSIFKNQQVQQMEDTQQPKLNDVPDEIVVDHQIKNGHFWNQTIDIVDAKLFVDKSPFTIQSDMSVVKLHFIFLMLGLQYAFITNQGQLLGIIEIHSFQ